LILFLLPEIPWPLVQPPAQRAPTNRKNPPKKLGQTSPPYLSFNGNWFDENEQRKLPSTAPSENKIVIRFDVPDLNESNEGNNCLNNLIRHNWATRTVKPVEMPKDFSKIKMKNNCRRPMPSPHNDGDQFGFSSGEK